MLQRLKPYLVYLTDGGSRERLEQTCRGLENAGLSARACFLNHSERSVYDALLAGDSEFFHEIADEISMAVRVLAPEQILCDAIEFYNPVHDISLPVVRAALRRCGETRVFEVPLIYRRPTESEEYELQRWPPSRHGRQVEFHLSEREVDAKIWARDKIYEALSVQLGPAILELPRAHAALEVMMPARSMVPEPGSDILLRYERRAQVLAERGEIEQQITYANHYVPLATSLLNGARRPAGATYASGSRG